MQSNKDILKRIHAQFSTQIEDISFGLLEERKQREEEVGAMVDALQKTYSRLHLIVSDVTKHREKNEKEIVDLLERIIEKIKREILEG